MKRGLEAARQATVRICNPQGDHKGQGLLLGLDGEGTIVLTCHHVIAGLENPEDLCVAIPGANGQLGNPIPAQFDVSRSHPEQDAVVLRIDGVHVDRNPWLHTLNPKVYDGASQFPATGLTYSGGTRTFQGKVGTPTPLEVPVETPGHWSNPPARYRLTTVYPLESSDTRPGISGSVLTCEEGVLGLVHFSRTEEPDLAREAYIVPLMVWAEKLPTLATLIEPLIDKPLRDATSFIKRARDIKIGSDIVVERFHPDVYLERTVDSNARVALKQCGGVIIIGKPKSGKTRLLWQLLQEQTESLVVVPLSTRPPETFEASSLMDHDLVLVFDDLHLIAETQGTLEWWERLRRATKRSCVVICTTRDGKDWDLVREKQQPLLKRLGTQALVYTSRVHADGKTHGEDLSTEEGWELAQSLGMNPEAFEAHKFDHTPGSLTLDLEDMKQRYRTLRNEQRGAISMARLLDSAKVLHAARQPVFRVRVLRAVAAQIRGNAPLSDEAWDDLLRRTQEEGFGRFDELTETFQIYHPYLEECVLLGPSRSQLEAVMSIMTEHEDYAGLFYLGLALDDQGSSQAEIAFRESGRGGIAVAYHNLGVLLAEQPGREQDAEQAFRDAFSAGRLESSNNLGVFLMNLPGREQDAEQAFEKAIKNGITQAYYNLSVLLYHKGRIRDSESICRDAIKAGNRDCFNILGMVLARKGRWTEAERAYRDAIAAGDKTAFNNLGYLVANQPGREDEAEELYRAAIASGLEAAYLNFGSLLSKQRGREHEAEKLFRAAIKAGDIKAFFSLGTLLAKQSGREHEVAPAYLTGAVLFTQHPALKADGCAILSQLESAGVPGAQEAYQQFCKVSGHATTGE